jgi:hypothetical protein
MRFIALILLSVQVALAQPLTLSDFATISTYPFDIYVDSVGGSDSNSGRSASAPFQTLQKAEDTAMLLGNGVRIGLKRGSEWRDEFQMSGKSRVMVRAYGAGDMPVIDCTDVVSGTWVQHDAGTYPNVWSIAWSSEIDGGGPSEHRAWENGTELLKQSTIAAINTTPGSMYAQAITSSTLYISTTDGTNPNTNGRTYEATKRKTGINGQEGVGYSWYVDGIWARRNSHLGGSIRVGYYSAVEACLIDQGHRHNMLTSGGIVEDVVLWGESAYYTVTGSVMLVGYHDDSRGNQNLSVRRVFIYGNEPGTLESTQGIYNHSAGGNGFTDMFIEQSVFVDIDNAISPNVLGTATIIAPYFIRCNKPLGGTAIGGTTMLYALDRDHASIAGFDMDNFTVRHLASYKGASFRLGNPMIIENSALWTDGNGFSPYSTGIDNLTFNRNITGCYSTAGSRNQVKVTGSGYIGDFNIFYNGWPAYQLYASRNGVNYTTLTTWQAATGQDSHSVYVKPPDQVAGGANALWLAYASAAPGTDPATIGPAVGDFRVNPNARAYNAAGTAFIGTFSDGVTALTTAGPQYHWDWNARAVTSGPPTAWPTVPTSIEESEQYVRSLNDWTY